MSDSAHAVAVVGGACAGSVVANILAEAGCHVAVFEQNPRPYGKIEDGLPRWHHKQRRLEYGRINDRLDHERVAYVPNTRLGGDVDFKDFATDWGWSVVVLANGAWKDRPMSSPSANDAVGHGLVYQNPFVFWFNHKDEADYAGPRYEIHDGSLVVGGGLASIDVVKIIQLELYAAALRERGIEVDVHEMEHKGIPRYCAARGIDDPTTLGIDGCTLLYRRRVQDMPLASLPNDATDKQKERLPLIREKILSNAQRKFLFKMQDRRLATDFVLEDGQVTGLRLVETRVEGRSALPVEGSEYVHHAKLVVSSIGSIPQPIEGVEMDGTYYKFKDWDTGEYGPLPHVFAAGNVITGQGNIKASMEHGERVGGWIADHYLGVGTAAADHVTAHLATRPKLSPAELDALFSRVRARQAAVGYDGGYRDWIAANTPPDMG